MAERRTSNCKLTVSNPHLTRDKDSADKLADGPRLLHILGYLTVTPDTFCVTVYILCWCSLLPLGGVSCCVIAALFRGCRDMGENTTRHCSSCLLASVTS